MIEKISVENVKCFKEITDFETNKKVNLLYGLNGTGKTTLSNLFYSINDPEYSKCVLQGYKGEEILVYNQRFIDDYFFESSELKGIFTLAKENKEAEQIIAEEKQKKVKITNEIKNNERILSDQKTSEASNRTKFEEAVWKIKTDFTGGDRVLEYCLERLGRKNLLSAHLLNVQKSVEKPNISIDEIKEEVSRLSGNDARKYQDLELLNLNLTNFCKDNVLEKIIIGNDEAIIGGLIKKLGNSDWVKKGLNYVSDTNQNTCPFCQQKTLTEDLVNEIRSYFDTTYEKDIEEIKNKFQEFNELFVQLPTLEKFEENPFFKNIKQDFLNVFFKLVEKLTYNYNCYKEKCEFPSRTYRLKPVDDEVESINHMLNEINKLIYEHNSKIDKKDEALNKLKSDFWKKMRWDYDTQIVNYLKEERILNDKIKKSNKELEELSIQLETIINKINEEQKRTVNIEEAIGNINVGLVGLGIEDFKIEPFEDQYYKIVRKGEKHHTFKTLSEGEKMLISFLYFRELAYGLSNIESIHDKKIVVIDDPVSSLSNVYVYSIGQLIKKDFFNTENFEQIFLMTHSLYFFYEMADGKKEKREENQNLLRLIKNNFGSQVKPMKYNEIQNDYHSYWAVINDKEQHPALIANCMRNIIEYFFGFIEKCDLNNVFQKPILKDRKFQSFCRYINRESHSDSRNIFDFKEFDYEIYREAFKHVFYESGYPEHFELMSKCYH